MNINRYNYEEYFLLYVDNELSATERKQVETFVAENPDLEEELMMLKQSLLKPDASLVLEDKSSLFKSEKHSLINLENYETFFLLYVDEELSSQERRAVELFASQHPAQQQELEILLQTRVTPDAAIVFSEKELLYRKVGSEKVIVFKAWRIVAVAAMLILAIGIWLSSVTNKQSHIAKTDGQVIKEEKNEKVAPESNDPVAVQSNQDKTIGKEETKNLVQVEDKQPKQNNSNLIASKKDESRQLPNHSLEQQNETGEEDVTVHPRMVAKIDAIQVEEKGSANFSDKTLIIEQPRPNENWDLTKAEGEPDDLAIGPIQTKNKFRGFFRRVTRVVEKNTHLPAGENKRLLIGNLEIALK